MNVLIIGNPISGIGQTHHKMHEFAGLLKQRGHRFELFETKRAGAAKRKASEIEPNIDRIVVAGGDGTINEVLNGLRNPSRIPILHLPTGTANQLALTLGLPFDTESLVDILEEGNIKYIDMGLAGNRRFLMIVSVGFDSWIVSEINKSRDASLGYSGYILPILKTLPFYEASPLKITLDNKKTVIGYNVMLLKVRRYGGLFVFADNAKLDSGHFDVCVLTEGSLSRLALYAVAGLLQFASELRDIQHYTAGKIHIDSEKPVPVEVDGDHFGTTPIQIDLRAGTVPVIVPPPNYIQERKKIPILGNRGLESIQKYVKLGLPKADFNNTFWNRNR